MYMDVGEIDNGFLVAKSFNSRSSLQPRYIEKKHGKLIKLSKLEDYGINHPATLEEKSRNIF